MAQLDELFSQLGLTHGNGLYITQEELWKTETSFPNRVKRLIERKIEPDAFFCFDNKPLILFFLNPTDKQKLYKTIWNFNECPIVFIIENGALEIFNGFRFIKETATLEKLGDNNTISNFNYFELVTGRTWELYKDNLDYKYRVDYHLLDNIKAARKILVEQQELDAKIANALIGKCIFVRYLIDRKVKMKFDDKLRTWTNAEFCELLTQPKKIQQFFDYLEDNEKGFNGDLFPLVNEEYKKITKANFDVLRRLLQGVDIAVNQPSLFELYDFSIIPIEFISNVYELFIGQDNQKIEGAYYTPLFLVDYILKETVEKHLSGIDRDKRLDHLMSKDDKSYSYCKVLDPACGSGIFLVETLRKIIEKFISDTNADIKSKSFKTAIKNLAKENIYGIDKDLSAVQVAIFSIYLTLLDYLDPPGIETFQFPNLLNTNFFEADFFDEELPFNDLLKNIEFNFILGNPPWMRGKGEKDKPLYVQYIDKRKKREKLSGSSQVDIGNREIAQAFLMRSSDFSKDSNTQCALIVTSKVLYNLQSAAFRQYFLKKFLVKRIFELAPVRREVFDKSNDKATAPACVLFYTYGNGADTQSNIVEHISLKPSRFFSLFKIFTINRSDFKTVQQKKLIEYDWLWKVLVYGSYLDFNFLKRLKENFKSINEIFIEKDALIKQGIKRKDGTKKIDVSELIGWDFLDLSKKEIQQFFINPKHSKWQIKEIGYVYRENGKVCKDVFSPPTLLVKETVNTKLESVSAIAYEKILFTDKVTSIKLRNATDTKDYYRLAALMNSTLFAYHVLNTSSTAGIMIEQQINDSERFSFPYVHSDNIIQLVQEIETLNAEVHSETLINQKKNLSIANKTKKVNQSIYKLFDLNSHEEALVSYAEDVVIPITMKHNSYQKLFKPLVYGDSNIDKYANLFIERFKSKLDTKEKKFVVEVWHTDQVIGMFFKMINNVKFSQNVIWCDKKNNDSDVISLLTKISSEKITDKLFVQKDIRGIEKDYFYIFKPNERRLWHNAIGYLDVNEFADAILKEGSLQDNV